MTQSKTSVERFIGSKEGFPTVNSDKSISTKTVAEAKTILDVPDQKAYLAAYSEDNIVVSDDANAPTYLTGLVLTNTLGFQLVSTPDTGAIRNVTGRTLNIVAGTINFHFIKSGGGVAQVEIVSEKSTDNGLTWQPNERSRRVLDVPNNGEGYKTFISSAVSWEDQVLMRFKVVRSGSGTVSFETSSSIIEGDLYTSPSVVWEITEA